MKEYVRVKQLAISIIPMLFLLLLKGQSFAQDKKVEVEIKNYNDGSWYASPWIWFAGAAVFTLLLVAILRDKSRNENA